MGLEQFQKKLAKISTVFLQCVFLLFFFRFFLFNVGVVNGESMEPSFHDQDNFVINKFLYLVSKPQRGDVIQLLDPYDNNVLLIKRIIGLPGEKIIFHSNDVYIENQFGAFKLNEPYLFETTQTKVLHGKPSEILLDSDTYFVLGDNREYSNNDSRVFGSVHRRLINGKVSYPKD